MDAIIKQLASEGWTREGATTSKFFFNKGKWFSVLVSIYFSGKSLYLEFTGWNKSLIIDGGDVPAHQISDLVKTEIKKFMGEDYES